MIFDNEKYLALLEKRLSLLRMLAQQILDSRKEFISMDLDGMYARIAEQEDLCRRIQSLHSAIVPLQQIRAEQLKLGQQNEVNLAEYAEWSKRFQSMMNQLVDAQAEVRRLNQIHAAYLRRSCRTNHVLINLLGNYALTYARPAEPVTALSQGRGRS